MDPREEAIAHFRTDVPRLAAAVERLPLGTVQRDASWCLDRPRRPIPHRRLGSSVRRWRWRRLGGGASSVGG